MLGTDLREVRLQQGLSIRELAEKAGLSKEAVSSVERGAKYPTLHTLECLAAALQIRIVIEPQETIVERN